jgi:hypothetical protein
VPGARTAMLGYGRKSSREWSRQVHDPKISGLNPVPATTSPSRGAARAALSRYRQGMEKLAAKDRRPPGDIWVTSSRRYVSFKECLIVQET